jgi:hypothetical protein
VQALVDVCTSAEWKRDGKQALTGLPPPGGRRFLSAYFRRRIANSASSLTSTENAEYAANATFSDLWMRADGDHLVTLPAIKSALDLPSRTCPKDARTRLPGPSRHNPFSTP